MADLKCSENDLFLHECARKLSSSPLLSTVFHDETRAPMPAGNEIKSIMEDIRAVIFPGYFSHSEMFPSSLEYYTGALLDSIYHRLSEQIERGFCFMCAESNNSDCSDCKCKSKEVTKTMIEKLADIRDLLASDAQAAFEGDPAARSIGETIFSYPSIRAMTNQRVAHQLFILDVPIIPRMITELAHSETGIDIHPGADIGKCFFIDHGTGVVIGETAVIGNNVRLYQGVTLGAKSFPLDAEGNPIKGIARHPIVEDDVVIYAGATILGRITIGKGSTVGANVWVTSDVAPGGKVMQRRQTDV
jgi:serine O-acetyltransferase